MKFLVAHSNQVQEDKPVPVAAGGRNVLLVRRGQGLFALENACPHQRSPLERGEILAHSIRCPLHGVEIDLGDGSVLANAGFKGLESVTTYRVEESEGSIYLEI